MSKPVADPRFPRRGLLTPDSGTPTYFFCKIFAQNCMKMKNLDREGAHPWRPPGSATANPSPNLNNPEIVIARMNDVKLTKTNNKI